MYAYVSNAPSNLIDPLGLWGFGGTVGGTGAAGLPFLGGVAGTGSAGMGLFGGGCRGTHLGGYVSYGATAVAPAEVGPDANVVVGAFAGGGAGLFLTNARSPRDLELTRLTYSLDVGIGPKRLRLSTQTSAGRGVWIVSLTYGPAIRIAFTKMPTTTEADPGSRSACRESKSNR